MCRHFDREHTIFTNFSHSWMSDVNTFPSLDAQIQFGPTYKYEYNTRQTYGANITGWGPNDPLNGTWWHLVTERKSLIHSSALIH